MTPLPNVVGAAPGLPVRSCRKLVRNACNALVSGAVLELAGVLLSAVVVLVVARDVVLVLAGAGLGAAVLPPKSVINRVKAAFRSDSVFDDACVVGAVPDAGEVAAKSLISAVSSAASPR